MSGQRLTVVRELVSFPQNGKIIAPDASSVRDQSGGGGGGVSNKVLLMLIKLLIKCVKYIMK